MYHVRTCMRYLIRDCVYWMLWIFRSASDCLGCLFLNTSLSAHTHTHIRTHTDTDRQMRARAHTHTQGLQTDTHKPAQWTKSYQNPNFQMRRCSAIRCQGSLRPWGSKTFKTQCQVKTLIFKRRCRRDAGAMNKVKTQCQVKTIMFKRRCRRDTGAMNKVDYKDCN